MMDADMIEKKDDGSDNKSKFQDSLITASYSPVLSDNSNAGSLTEATSFSEEQLSTCDKASSSTEIPLNVLQNKTKEALHNTSKGGVTRAVSVCLSVEKEQPMSSMETCTVYEVSQSITTISRSQESLKTTSMVHTQPGGDDLCAAILMACLFCHPLDCLLATMRGCSRCIWSLCSALCGCEPPTTLQPPLLDFTHHCGMCSSCVDVRCFFCESHICDLCLQTTECLDLAMEMSQMLYH